MKEISDIIRAYRTALADGIRMALATVVKVEGSSYRQPGARMLVTEDGHLTGAISGGCLEGDALQKALLVIHQRKNRLITYDTGSEEGSQFAVQLGCEGIIHILFEYIDTDNPNNPVALLEHLQSSRQETVVITLFSTKNKNEQSGTAHLTNRRYTLSSYIDLGALGALKDDILLAKVNRQSFITEIQLNGVWTEALIQYVAPAVHLVIAGAGNDAKPLVEVAGVLGWETTVVDGRATHALPYRFPKATRVIVARPEQVTTHIEMDSFTVFVLMTHNYRYDLELLQLLIGTDTPYIGMLGPKTKLERTFHDLEQEGLIIGNRDRKRIYGPVGLQIGAETSEEIAISIVSEIKAVMNGKTGGSLKFLNERIHGDFPYIP